MTPEELRRQMDELGLTPDQVSELLTRESAKQAGLTYINIVNHEKYGWQCEFYPGSDNKHKPFSLSPNKVHSILRHLPEVRGFYEKQYRGANKVINQKNRTTTKKRK